MGGGYIWHLILGHTLGRYVVGFVPQGGGGGGVVISHL